MKNKNLVMILGLAAASCTYEIILPEDDGSIYQGAGGSDSSSSYTSSSSKSSTSSTSSGSGVPDKYQYCDEDILERLTDNNNGTVSDNVSGLMWQQDGGTSGLKWLEAQDYCGNLSLAGFSNWRLPTKLEFFEVSDGGSECGYVCINAFFPNQKNGDYWTIEAVNGNAYISGVCHKIDKQSKNSPYVSTMCVRSM
jgi:hypothetical protein